MADTPDLGSGAARCAGSTPAPSTLFAQGAKMEFNAKQALTIRKSKESAAYQSLALIQISCEFHHLFGSGSFFA